MYANMNADMNDNRRFKLMMTEWQEHMETVQQRDMYVLEESMWTDCKFLVGNTRKEYTCHRVYLSKTSSVFAAMLYGDLACYQSTVTIPDISAAAFDAMLKYVYTGEVTKLDFQVACELLYAAKKYIIYHLYMLARDMLSSYITIEQVWDVVEFASLNDEADLLGNAWHFILENASDVINCDTFLHIQHPTLVTLVQQQYINLKSELELYTACLKWAANQMNEENSITGEEVATNYQPKTRGSRPKTTGSRPKTTVSKSKAVKLRQTLGLVVKHIRFLAMSVEEFSSEPTKDKILTSAEYKMITTFQNTSRIDPCFTLSRNEINRFPYNHMYIIATPIDAIPKSVDEYKSYQFNNDAFIEYESKQAQLGIQIPTQIETVLSNATQYDEHVSIIAYSVSREKIVVCTTSAAKANFDSLINIAYSSQLYFHDFWEILNIHIIFHKSGFYPRDVCSKWYNMDKTKKQIGEFGDAKASFVWEPEFKFIAHVVEELPDGIYEEEMV